MDEEMKHPWESDGDLPWLADGAWDGAEDGESWRGELHLPDWPEEFAGPEYWLFKQDDEES
ncbi:MAG: hypothetical protein NW201_09780 [Gemmatimonadales bacterium]|nr:hypothetical protein [Gemmatimonadales bacterium]